MLKPNLKKTKIVISPEMNVNFFPESRKVYLLQPHLTHGVFSVVDTTEQESSLKISTQKGKNLMNVSSYG